MSPSLRWYTGAATSGILLISNGESIVKTAWGIVLLCVLAATPVTGAGKLVDEVVRMLEQGVDVSLITSWLGLQDPGVEPVTPDDLIRLTKAGAPEDLVQRLLERSGRAPAVSPPPLAASPESAVTAAPAPARDGLVPLALDVTYEPHASFDLADQDEFELFVYLDGRLVARRENPLSRSKGGEGLLETHLEPGRHEIRLLREEHRRKRGGRRFTHYAMVCPDAIEFEVTRGHDWALAIEWVEPRFSSMKSPLTWRLTRDGQPIAGVEKSGTPKSDWPPLCEDLETALSSGGKASRLTRQLLDDCVRWDGLWSASVQAPSRGTVLAEIERDAAAD